MQKLLLFLLISSLSLQCISQINFEKGYLIYNNNQTVECLIKNIDWVDNPKSFEYKLIENGDIKIGTIDNIKEFGIHDFSKYKRAQVEIDRSSEEISELSSNRNPEFKTETLFLRLLVKGDASLYYYNENTLKRFFFNIDNTQIKQLVYKAYSYQNTQVNYNKEYRMQLWQNLNCNSAKMSDFEFIEYDKNEFIKQFEKYNKCKNPSYSNFKQTRPKAFLSLNIKPRFTSNSLSIRDTSRGEFHDFGNQSSFEIGFELESILKFNKNKWATFIELNYNSFNGESFTKTPETRISNRNIIIHYKYIELGFGVRHYLFLNKNSKFFINALYVLDFATSNSKLIDQIISKSTKQVTSSSEYSTANTSHSALGLGYKYLNKYSAELRLNQVKGIFSSIWPSEHKSISLILGYTVF